MKVVNNNTDDGDDGGGDGVADGENGSERVGGGP